MSEHTLPAKELAQLLGVLSHPKRIRIVEELTDGERDVNALQAVLEISHAGVSQHLGVLRAHRVVVERREGRHVFYHLRRPEIAGWLAVGLRFLEGERQAHDPPSAGKWVRELWWETRAPVRPPERGAEGERSESQDCSSLGLFRNS